MADTDLLELEAPDLEDALNEGEEPEGKPGEVEGEPQQEGEGEKPPPPTSLFQADGKKLDPAIKAVLADIKTKSPESARMVAKALYDLGQVQREFPGGLAEAKELRDKIDGLGGLEKIDEDLADLQFLSEYDNKFTAGDPAFVDGLVEADPAAFVKLAPAVFAKYAEVHPDGWKNYIGKTVYSDFQSNDIPVQLTRLADSIRRKDEAGTIESYNAIAAYLATWKELAGMQVGDPKLKAAERPNNSNIDKRESDLRAREWQTEHAGIERRIVQDEYKTAVGTRKPSTEEKAQIQELFLAKRHTLARQYFPDQQKKLDQLRQRNDKAGFMRLATIMHKRVTPEAMRWAVSRTLKATTKPTTGQQQQRQRREPARQTASNGNGSIFKFVANEPATYDIDYSRTPKSMLAENKAYLKGQTEGVQWRDK